MRQRLPALAVTFALLVIAAVYVDRTLGLGPRTSLAAAAAPTLTAPAAGATLPAFSTVLSWTNPPGATQVHLQVIPVNNDGPGVNLYFGSALTSFDVPAPPTWYGLLPDLSYTWRVRVSDAATGVELNDPSWSTPAERTFRTPPVDSSSISLLSPGAGATVTSLTPTLRWGNQRSDVYYYEVQVSKDAAFNTDPATATAMVYWELRHGGVTDPPNSYAVPAGFPLEINTRYFWRVRPRVQGDGTPVAWTPAFDFQTAASTPSATATPPGGATATPTRTPVGGATAFPTGTPTPTSTPTVIPGTGATATSTTTPGTGTTNTPTSTPTRTPTRTPTPSGGTTGELVTNGTFEGSGGWSDGCNCITSAAVVGGWNSGSKGAKLLPAEGSTSASIYQIISLPGGGNTVTLTYWYRLEGTDANDDDCFVAGVSAGSQVLASKERCVRQGYVTGWTKETMNLSGLGQGSVFLTFGLTARSSRNHQNYALLDDVSIFVQ